MIKYTISQIRITRALHSRSFALLWVGQTISIVGNGAFSTALAWEVLLLTGSATAMGLIVTAQAIPMLLFMSHPEFSENLSSIISMLTPE